MTSCFRLSNCQGFYSHLKKMVCNQVSAMLPSKSLAEKNMPQAVEKSWANALNQWLDDNDPMPIETKDLGDL